MTGVDLALYIPTLLYMFILRYLALPWTVEFGSVVILWESITAISHLAPCTILFKDLLLYACACALLVVLTSNDGIQVLNIATCPLPS